MGDRTRGHKAPSAMRRPATGHAESRRPTPLLLPRPAQLAGCRAPTTGRAGCAARLRPSVVADCDGRAGGGERDWSGHTFPPMGSCSGPRIERLQPRGMLGAAVALHGLEHGCGLRPLCGRARRRGGGQSSRESAGQAGMNAPRLRTRYNSSLIGMQPSLPGPKRRLTSVPAGQRPFRWAWEDLNLRPHHYQGSPPGLLRASPPPTALLTPVVGPNEGRNERWGLDRYGRLSLWITRM
jgi:hypothetical protein